MSRIANSLATTAALIAVWGASTQAAPPAIHHWSEDAPALTGERIVTSGPTVRGVGPGFQVGADHIVSYQCASGGWGWEHPTCPTATFNNISAPIALGLLHAYGYTADPDHLAAAVAAGNYDLGFQYGTGQPRFSTGTPYFLVTLSTVSTNPSFASHVDAEFFGALDDGSYGASDDVDTAEWIASVQAGRTGAWINLRPWEFDSIIAAALVLSRGTQATQFADAVRDGLNTLDNTNPGSVYSDLIGLTGGVRGLAFANMPTFPAIVAPNHAGINGISTLEDLADKLVSYQNADGSWYWHSNLTGATESDKDTQTTAYAILALIQADPLVSSDYSAAVKKGRDWLRTMQLPHGGFRSWPGGTENLEIEGEAINALAPDGCMDNVLELRLAPGSDCVKPTETVRVELWRRGMLQDTRGFQAFTQFDSGMLAFGSGTYTAAPYSVPVITPILASGDNIDLASGVTFGGPASDQAPAQLATLNFTAGSTQGSAVISFRDHNPPSRFSSSTGTEVIACLVESLDILIDGTDPIITCPGNPTISCDASTLPANTGSATATDNLDDFPVVTYADVFTPNMGCTYTGSIARTWTATDCAGNSRSCIQTITIVDNVAPTLTIPSDVTIECDESTLPASTGVVESMTFDVSPAVGPTQAAGVWYSDRYAPAGFASANFGGNRLKHSIGAGDCETCRPGGFNSPFYNTQGRKYDLPGGTTRMSIDVYVPADWGTSGRRMAGLWGTGFDSVASVSSYPIIEFTSSPDGTGVPRFRGYANGVWIDMGLPTGFAYGNWYTLTIELVGTNWVYTVGDLQAITPAFTTVEIGNVILQGHNTVAGVSYDIYWDNFIAAQTTIAVDNCDPSPAITYSDNTSGLTGCDDTGTIVRTWTATDACGRTTSDDQIITVIDTGNPVLTCPAPTTIQCDASTLPSNTGSPTAVADTCDASPVVTYSDNSQTLITPTNLDGWTMFATTAGTNNPGGDGMANIVTGPGTPPLGIGSAHLFTGGNGEQSAQLRNNAWAGTRIDDLTTLKYSTYATSWNGQQLPYLTIYLDTNNDNVRDDRLWFEPDYSGPGAGNGNPSPQAPVALNVWQTWNCLTGMWYSDQHAGPGSNAITLDDYLLLKPNAKIINDGALGGIRIASGFASDTDDFEAYVDAFEIGTADETITYNFEPSGCANHVITRTWTATDECLNDTSCIQLITVQDTTDPVLTIPPDITVNADAGVCTATLVPGGLALDEAFNTSPNLTTWTVDRYAPGAFDSQSFGSDNRLHIGISAADSSANRPPAYSSTFYNTQGRTRSLNNSPVGTTISADLYIPAAWATAVRRSDMWLRDVNPVEANAEYPIIGFTSEDPSDNLNPTPASPTPRYRYWDGATGWVNLPAVPVVYNAWHTLSITVTATSFQYRIDGVLVATDSTVSQPGYAALKQVIFQAYNFGASYDVYWDNLRSNAVGTPSATDNCDGAPTITGVRSDSQPLTAPYPAGTTDIVWTATDACNNDVSATQHVTVVASNELVVDVELEGLSAFTGSRCITFELWNCGNPPVVVSEVLDFVNGVASDQTLLVPCGAYTCITARDELHTLRNTISPLQTSGTQYIASFTGSKALIGGNLNDDYWVDILDFGVYSFKFTTKYRDGVEVLAAPVNGNTDCSTAYPHADIDGDGIVFTGDFSFIFTHFLDGNEPNCCGAPLQIPGPITDITVAELRKRGLGALSVADLNKDGRLNDQDIAAFAAGARPKPGRAVERLPVLQDAVDGFELTHN